MNRDMALLQAMRRVLEQVSHGKGISSSLVEELGSIAPEGKEVARRVLTGLPLGMALRPVSSSSQEVALLAALVEHSPNGSSSWMGRSGEGVSAVLERWVKSRENRRLNARVMAFRGMLTSCILGAVAGVLAALGPVLGSLSFESPPPPRPSLPYAAAAMAVASSAMLGLYLAPRRAYLNVMATGLVYAAAWLAMSPLGALQPFQWAIK